MNEHDRRHLRRLEAIARMVERIYDAAAEDAAAIGAMAMRLGADGEEPFDFEDYPQTKERMDELLSWLREQLEMAVGDGIAGEWLLSEDKNDALVRRVLGLGEDDDFDALPEDVRRRWFDRNEKGCEAFLKRKERGLGLSERVWKATETIPNEMAMGIDMGIRAGKPAAAMARDLKQYLKHPDKLFRRVRDERGILHLSKNAAAFHPGQGVYRSSYQNARRLAVTEVNMAYRTADHERWQQLDFVVGIEVHLSGNHTCKGRDGKPHRFEDICDLLKGKYPKDFKFTGWHPHCRCYATSILKTEEEMDADMDRMMAGEPVDGESVNKVTEPPKGFSDWVEKNEERIAGARERGTLPGWVKENERLVGVKGESRTMAGAPKPNVVEEKNEADDVKGESQLLGPSQSFPDANIDFVTAEEANKIMECKARHDIMEIQDYEGLKDYMIKEGLVTNLDLSKIPIDMAKEICATWAQIQQDWNLPPIKIFTNLLSNKTFASGCGEFICLNEEVFGTKAADNILEKYKENAGEWLTKRKKNIEDYKKRSKAYQGFIDAAERQGNTSTVESLKGTKESMDMLIQKYEDWIAKGHTRHNIFFSEKTMLRNNIQHESGHVLDDILLGASNGDVYRLKDRLTTDEMNQMKREMSDIFSKYKSNCGWLSTYGSEKRTEFVAECMVLYSEKGGEGLPREVKAWFDKLKELSLRKRNG